MTAPKTPPAPQGESPTRGRKWWCKTCGEPLGPACGPEHVVVAPHDPGWADVAHFFEQIEGER